MAVSIVEDLKRLADNLNAVEGQFRLQREELRKLAMGLPPGTISGLQSIRSDMMRLAKTFEDSQTELNRLRSLSRTAELINSTLDLDDVLNQVMDTVIGLTAAERGYLMLRNSDSGAMEFRVARNIEQRTLNEDEFIVSSSIVAEVARSGKPVVTTNAAQDDRFSAQQSVAQYMLRSILCVPLSLKGQVTGVVYADNRIKSGLFGEKELELLYAFASQAAIAIENARLFESLQLSLREIIAVRDLLENIFASIASGVITTNESDLVITLNKAASRILAVQPQGVVGQPLGSVLPIYDEFKGLFEDVRDQRDQKTLEVESEIHARGQVSLNLKLSPLQDGGTSGVAIVVDDLTELKQREAQLTLVRRYLPPAMLDNIESIDRLGLGGERRLVTTMFIDVRNFNTFPKSLRPQDLMETLNAYLTIAADAISRQNGVIDKYMANEIMGLFNTQLNPDEDHHARQAILAAMNMCDRYLQFYRDRGEPDGVCYYRIGIHMGIATLGNVGSETRKEFTAIGDSVNLAHRLLENAQPGQIIISENTYKAVEGFINDPANHIQAIRGGEILVKGRQQPTMIYQLQRT
jgi:PAS domain S-box-containing protein